MSKYCLLLVFFVIMMVLAPVPARPSDSGYSGHAGQDFGGCFSAFACECLETPPPSEEQAKSAPLQPATPW